MIQNEGKIKVPNAKASEAVQKALFAEGHEWHCNKTLVAHTDRSWLGWGLYQRPGLYVIGDSGFDHLTTHTLADFGLNDQGEPLPAFGNLKPGDPNPFVVGMEVKTRLGYATVKQASNGPLIRIKYENRSDGCFGFEGGHQIGFYSINTVLPVEPASQPEKPRFEFGDKVKVGKRMYRFLCYTQDGLALVCSDYEFDHATLGPYDVSARSVMAEDVTPWPTPITIPLNDNHEATVTPDGITVGCQTFPLSVIDALVEARKKMEQ